MLCKVLKPEKVAGQKFAPGLHDVPDWAVPELEARGIVVRIEQPMFNNAGAPGLLPNAPVGHVLVKLPVNATS